MLSRYAAHRDGLAVRGVAGSTLKQQPTSNNKSSKTKKDGKNDSKNAKDFLREYNKTKQPGLTKYSNITMKRGTFQSDNEYYDWWKETRMFQEGNSTGSLYRRDLTISLLNESHEPIIVWKVKNAWPTKIQTTDLKADGNEVAIESMELVHEGLTVQND